MMRFALSMFVLTLLAPQAWALGASYQDVQGPKDKAEKNTKGPHVQGPKDKAEKNTKVPKIRPRRGTANQSLSPSPQRSHSLPRELVWLWPVSSGRTDSVSCCSACWEPRHQH